MGKWGAGCSWTPKHDKIFRLQLSPDIKLNQWFVSEHAKNLKTQNFLNSYQQESSPGKMRFMVAALQLASVSQQTLGSGTHISPICNRVRQFVCRNPGIVQCIALVSRYCHMPIFGLRKSSRWVDANTLRNGCVGCFARIWGKNHRHRYSKGSAWSLYLGSYSSFCSLLLHLLEN